MRKVTAGLFMTLDGVVEAPGSGDTTLPGKRGWSERFTNEEIGTLILNQIDNCDALLLGRKTYQGFAAFWPSVPDENPFGYRMNNTPKVVVSTTLSSVEWKNSTLLKGNLADEINRLKQQPGKNISMTGSTELVYSLLQLGLIDELQLMICPVVLGVGKRLFKESDVPLYLKLADSRSFSTGIVMLTYQPAS
ncbi:MAG: dihydrofolate reductase family protein [Anaerolineae bacterium]